jgi:hypothetical protein
MTGIGPIVAAADRGPFGTQAVRGGGAEVSRSPATVYGVARFGGKGTYRGKPLRSANTRTWRAALTKCGITDFRWHDLRHTWASWLRQSDVPTWVLQELGGWKSESMVRRYAHMSVKHLQPYADQLTFVPRIREDGGAQKTAEADGAKSPTAPRRGVLILASQDGIRC